VVVTIDTADSSGVAATIEIDVLAIEVAMPSCISTTIGSDDRDPDLSAQTRFPQSFHRSRLFSDVAQTRPSDRLNKKKLSAMLIVVGSCG
jgi:hypothetical protein